MYLPSWPRKIHLNPKGRWLFLIAAQRYVSFVNCGLRFAFVYAYLERHLRLRALFAHSGIPHRCDVPYDRFLGQIEGEGS